MNRSPWNAVFWTVLVLVGATLSSYVPWNHLAPSMARTASRAASRELAQLNRWIDERRFVMALDALAHPAAHRLPAATIAGGAACVAALLALFIVSAIRARRLRLRVLRLAQRGNPLNEIARDTRMPQDAVRLLLSPMIDPSRSRVRSGKSFRIAPAFSSARSRGVKGNASAS